MVPSFLHSCATIVACFGARAAAVRIASLTVEHLPAAPATGGPGFASLLYALDAPKPRFGWQLIDSPSVQLSYRIVATAAAGGAALWDSGTVLSNATTQIVWAGAQLAADIDVLFSVTVATASSGGASASARFTTALFTPSDWRGATWVGGGGALRSTFSLPPGVSVTRAVAHVTGVGMYELHVNGRVVNALPDGRQTFLSPGFSTVYSERVLYQSWDVSPLLVEGINAIGIRLGAGKYGYLGEFCVDGPLACNAAILSLAVHMADGSTVPLVTDGRWLAGPSTIVENTASFNLYNGETVDARLAPPDWAAAAFVPTAAWTPAVVRTSPTRTLSAHAMPPIAAWTAPRTAVSVTPVSGDASSFTLDFGSNGAAVCELALPPLAAGARVGIVFAEEVVAHGTGGVHVGFACPSACCADGGNCANQSYLFTSSGDSSVTSFAPSFAYPAFRFAQLKGWPLDAPPPTAMTLTCTPTSTAAAASGSVAFNDTIMDGVQAMIIRTQRASFHSIPTDCPQREKRGWMAGELGRSASHNCLPLVLHAAH